MLFKSHLLDIHTYTGLRLLHKPIHRPPSIMSRPGVPAIQRRTSEIAQTLLRENKTHTPVSTADIGTKRKIICFSGRLLPRPCRSLPCSGAMRCTQTSPQATESTMAHRLNVDWPTLLGQPGHGQDKLACSRFTGSVEAVIPPVCTSLMFNHFHHANATRLYHNYLIDLS